ncbi:MAG: prolyl oligopeptidase family serine peptidase [Spirochaetia bacterium]
MRVEKDISYLGAGRTEKMDIYTPDRGAAPRPGVIVIHGGGWFSGKKESPREVNICTNLSGRGIVCASIDYTLADDSCPESAPRVWPQNLADCKSAVFYLRKNGDRYGIDPDRIAAFGSSAGGHLAALLGCTHEEHGFDPPGSRPGRIGSCPEGYPYRVSCVISMYGPADPGKWIGESRTPTKGMEILKHIMGGSPEDVPERYRSFSPVNYIDHRTCPFLLIHGTNDSIIPPSHSRFFRDELSKHGIPNELLLVPGARHSFHLRPEGADLVQPAADFLRKHKSA